MANVDPETADQVPENMPANMPAEIVRKVAEALEDATLCYLGRDLGTIHRDDIAATALAVAEPLIRERALLDAADAWQRGAWADTPRHADQVADRIAAAQYAGDWLRERAARAATTEGEQ